MNSFWDRLYDKFKDRRYGTLFLFTVLALVGLPIVVVIIDAILREFNLENYFLDALPGIGVLALAWDFFDIPPGAGAETGKIAASTLVA